MKIQATVPVSLFLLCLCLPVQAGELEQYPDFGSTPPLLLRDLGDREHALTDYRGQVVLVNFWASWCSPCLVEMPSMQRLQRSLAGRPFAILAVNVRESREKAWRVRKRLGVDFTTLLDSNGVVTGDWDVQVYPTSFLVDPEGRIRYIAYGMVRWDDDPAQQVIEQLMPDREAVQAASVR
ncbi:MAG: TlpA disulfide reductase family protein [Gammaproteobacteria bacterium]